VAKLTPIELAAEVVTSFIANNSLPRGELPSLIEAVQAVVKRLAAGGEVAAAVIDPPVPPVSIRKSVTPDYLICLEDGKRFKSLRRHLATLGMTPEQYREKWNLSPTYPMVAPNYAARRSALAKTIGLGQLRRRPVVAPPVGVRSIEVVAPEPVNVAASEAVVALRTTAGMIHEVASAPTHIAKRQAKANPKNEAVAAGLGATAKRKPGRPRKAKV
jgi:predicted transcriptional regulator